VTIGANRRKMQNLRGIQGKEKERTRRAQCREGVFSAKRAKKVFERGRQKAKKKVTE